MNIWTRFSDSIFKKCVFVCLTLVLTSCASSVQRPSVEEPVKYDSQPAVVALLSDAQRENESGDFDKAAASLERALSIDPGDAMAWHRLARLRLRQGAVDEAISLANKSSQLAQDTPALRRANWYLIANAYDQKGNPDKATKAREKAFSY